MSNKRTYIRPDETLYVDGKLIVRGNVTQIEETQVINNLESNVLVINTDADSTLSALKLRSNVNTGVDGSVSYDGDNLILEPNVLLPGLLTVEDLFVTNSLEFSDTADFGANAVLAIRDKFSVTNQVQAWNNALLTYDNTTGVYNYRGVRDTEVHGIFGVFNNPLPTNWTSSRIEYNNDGVYRYFAPTEADVRSTISVVSITDPSGWSAADLTYDVVTGVIDYVAPTQAEVRATISVSSTTDATGWSAADLTYDAVTGVIDYVAPTQAEVRATISSTSTTDIWSLSNVTYDAATGVIDYVAPTVLEVRDVISVTDTGGQGSMSYDNITGVITYTGPSQTEANTAILDFIDATYGVNLDPDGNLYVDVAETATLADDQTFTGAKTFQGDVNLEAANVSGHTVNGELVVDGNLNVLGNINSVTQVDLFVTDTQITLNANAAVGVDSYVRVERGVDPDVALRWQEGLNRWEFTNDGITYLPMAASTTDLQEGTNLYYTDERVDDRVAGILSTTGNLAFTYDDNLGTITLSETLTTDDIDEGSNLYYTTDRANVAMDDYILAGNGVIRTAPDLTLNVGQGDGILVDSDNVSVDSTVIRTTGDFLLAGNIGFTGSISIPSEVTTGDGSMYYTSATNQAWIVIDGQALEITPATDYGTFENAPGSELGTANVIAGVREVVSGNANIQVAGFKSISVGANMSLTDSGNVITLDADGLNITEVRQALGVLDNGGFGDLSYDNTTGDFTYTGVSVSQIRSQLSGTGLISYNTGTGVISTSADNYGSWSYQTDTGGTQTVASGDVVEFQGNNGILVTNSGGVITVSGSGGDITSVVAGDGLSGGGLSGTVTLNVDNSVIRTTGGQTITGDLTVTGVINGTATSARYADLAEIYSADIPYVPGTVLVFGGEHEVAASTAAMDHRVAGVVSTEPAHLMNSEHQCDHPVAIALRGRIPVQVMGEVRRGDILVTAPNRGMAMAAADPLAVPAACIIGKAMADKTDPGPGTVEVMV
jgi:hypothetical protein